MTSYPEDSVSNHPDAIEDPKYPPEDDGTMPDNVACLREHLIGRRIIRAEKGTARAGDLRKVNDDYDYERTNRPDHQREGLILTLDDGRRVVLEHIFADLGDIIELDVEWSEGNPFYYGYGFDIYVSDTIDSYVIPAELEK
ncbi:hypothetical protein SEA_ANGELIQUE_70 [Gordonia phage Angelique]|nr:hypothetical protein SEA_ANGELIQUE_70 [Gordonia phage Angelique]